jgi:signal transduction histidine kinase
MSDRALVRTFRVTVVIGGALAVIGSAVLIAIADAESWWSGFGAFMTLLSVFFAVFVWLVIPQQPRNVVVWIMAGSAFLGVLWIAGSAAAVVLVRDDPDLVNLVLRSSGIVPADLRRATAWIKMVTEPASMVAVFLWLTFGLLLFPDGRLPSSRWRWVGVFAVIAILVTTVTLVWGYRPWNTARADQGLLLDIGFVASILAVILSLVSLVVRFRNSSGETRDRVKWIVWGASIFVPTIIVSIFFGDTQYEDLTTAPVVAAEVIFLGSYGIAVGRYRLFDVDVLISRTVVVAGLAGFITVVYAAVVGAAGLLLGFGTGAALPLSIAATVVVAIAFQPLRLRMRRWADRLVYGERATPYEVLSRFSERMRDAVATEDLIPQMAQLLTQGTGASQAIVWMKTGNEYQPAATWPEEDVVSAPVRGNDGELSIPGVNHLAPVEHDGELLGAVTVTMPRGETLTATEERLVDDVASQAGLVLRNARLIRQLRSSRQRLVAAQDEERRRLERDLHDGAQQQIIAVKLKVTLAQMLIERGDGDRAAEMLEQVVAETAEAVESLRDLAHGIYPPLLEAEGLEAALTARAAKAPVAVSVTAHGLGRYSPEIEAAVYFCVLESIQNAVKYAEAHTVNVTLQHQDSQLVFEVADEGRGFDPATQTQGRGLVNMTDRLDALGGALKVRSAPGEGTTITGSLDAVATPPQVTIHRTDRIPTLQTG